VEAAFELAGDGAIGAELAERGLDVLDGELVVRRELAAAGTGRVVVNGSPSTVSVLKGIAERLVDLHGQHEHQGLLSSERHLELLDAYGGNLAARAAVESACREVKEAEDCLAALITLGAEGKRRAEELNQTAREIRGLDPKPGELETLTRERSILLNGARVAELLDEAIARLDDGDDPAIAALHAAERRVGELARIDPSLQSLASRLESARLEIEDARDTLTAYRDNANFDPARLETIESRRAALERLLLKWGPTEDDAIESAAEAERELHTIDHLDDALKSGENAVTAARARYTESAAALTARRVRAAAKLSPAVEAELKPLAFGSARFEVVLPPARTPFHPAGAERAEFHLAANPGEAARPIGRAASGGELSRLMLALHVVLDATDGGRVLVFDEVDAGVSGSVAVAVGARLARLAVRHQVLCVTHLPQVAAHASAHFRVQKRVTAGRTHTEIEALVGDARVEELARMLGGRKTTTASRENAAELLAEAGKELS
jgi:DNA repair protein RecN (Recombination protein N)